MPVARFAFFQQLPAIVVTFQPSGPHLAIERRLLVDSGFSGQSAFVLSPADCDRFRRRRAPRSQVAGALVGSHQRVWVKGSIATLRFSAHCIALSSDLAACSLPTGVDGLAGLAFLNQFERWGAERLAGGDWEFVLDTGP